MTETRMTTPRTWRECPACGKRRAYLQREPTGVQVSIDDMPPPVRIRCSACGWSEKIE